MCKKTFKIILTLAILIPFSAAFALLPFSNDKSYVSGVYAGIQGGYLYAVDNYKYDGVKSSQDHSDNLDAASGGAYLGYGHVFTHGNLPYLGAEIGFSLRSNYNKSSTDLYGAKINAQGGVSADILLGFFWDNQDTTLVYGRLGIEGDQFHLSGTGITGNNLSDHKYCGLYRVGAGIEHEIVNNVYARLDYVFASTIDNVKFNDGSNKYSSRVYLNTFTLGITYRF